MLFKVCCFCICFQVYIRKNLLLFSKMIFSMNMLLSNAINWFKTIEGYSLGKKKVLSEGDINKAVYPGQGEVLGVVTKLLGFDRIQVKCQDGADRLCRICGKMKRRVWIRENDIVIVAPWDFQSDTRGDVVWRYTHAQSDDLRRKGLLTL
jgi:translation initiation factor 1A